jgi:hypothetical protein
LLAIEPHRLGDQRLRRAELGECGPVARHLKRRREPRVPGVRNIRGPHQAGVVGEHHGEARLGDDGLTGRREVQAEPAIQGGIDRQQRDVAGGVDLVDHHHPALAHRLDERRVDQLHLPAGAGEWHVVVAEEELVRRRAGLQLDEPVERGAVPVGHLPSAAGPQAVGDRAGDLALARPGRANQAQKARLCRVVHVEQRERELVDRLAVQQRRVDPLPSGSRIASPAVSSLSGIEGSGASSRSAATPSICNRAAVIALMRASFFKG